MSNLIEGLGSGQTVDFLRIEIAEAHPQDFFVASYPDCRATLDDQAARATKYFGHVRVHMAF